jgi:predicted acylesterase/phospholipase RssA
MKGAAFSAGVIHAYLAADRPPPKVAAGISTGALSAAALERCYRELPAAGPPPQREVKRWSWFRRYLDTITCTPLDVIWHAIPDPVDFFADKPPVSDLSAGALPKELQDEEVEARRNYYRLVKLGLWLAGLRVSVRDVATTIVARVRFKERYGYHRLERVHFYVSLAVIVMKVFVHLCFSPQFTVERPKWFGSRRFPRPLFGWAAWGAAVGVVGLGAGVVLRGLVYVLPRIKSSIDENWTWLSGLLSIFDQDGAASRLLKLVLTFVPQIVKAGARYDLWLSWGSFAILALGLMALFRFGLGGATRHLLTELGVVRGMLHRYTLHRKLFELFRTGPDDQEGPRIGSPPDPAKPPAQFPASMHLLMVAAPLQVIPGLNNQQLWGTHGTPLVKALLAALAAPGMFEPVRITGRDEVKQWLAEDRMQQLPERLDLIDGVAVRQNPLPALFSWLQKHPAVANELCGDDPADAGIQLVYNVPIDAYDQDPDKTAPERVDIVAAAFASLELSRRRDTKMEFRQTNFLSAIELWVRTMEKRHPQIAASVAAGASSSASSSVISSTGESQGRSYTAFPIFAGEIAPEKDIVFDNYLAPKRETLLKSAAEGCRRSLETLYREHLRTLEQSLPPAKPDEHGARVDCAALLRQVAHGRKDFISLEAPGLREVCAACTRKLIHRPAGEAPFKDVPAEQFKHLSAAKPRIVFVASGGVFRGAFHIGVIAAMQAAGIRPNLVVGASVGTLMGGALGAISKTGGDAGWDLLAELCLTFLHVDKRIALTKTLKNAAKQLGVRTRTVKLSPAQLRRMVRRGTRSDPGYAVAGAPPALIDAISTVFLIPHEATRGIASNFVAGHITQAMKDFWMGVREETLRQLDIEDALMGTSLIENAARTLLGQGRPGIDLNTPQPYHDLADPDRSISFFGTTSDLNCRRPLLLPRDLDTTSAYDFVKAGLSSSAFPVVFAPRREADVRPGAGATNVLFSDGGMFDNLPFFPAIEVMGSAQRQWRDRIPETAHQSLKRRHSQPDLFVAAALESPGEAGAGQAEDVLEVYRRAASLKVNIKLESFRNASVLVDRQIAHLIQLTEGQHLPHGLPGFMDDVVSAGVLKIVPTDRKHLNRTFAFCSSLGMKRDVVGTSIADGCFQTLNSLVSARTSNDPLLRKTVAYLQSEQGEKKIQEVTRNDAKHLRADGRACPFFKVAGNSFECPFHSAAQHCHGDEQKKASSELLDIYKACTHDSAHQDLWKAASSPK